jgi:hypothetical protein
LEVDVNQQLFGKMASGDSLADNALPDIGLSEEYPDGSAGEEGSSTHVGEEEVFVAFGLWLGL